jgi:PAS domain S-box-containing protein
MPELKPFLDGGGEMGALVREHLWEKTPLGPIRHWPQSLRSSLSICLRSPSATAICWGSDYRFLYNDAWSRFLGERHPWALGRPASEVMADIWPVLEEQFRTVVENGTSVNVVDLLLVRNLDALTYDSYWSYSLLPVASEDGTVGGLLAQAQDTTERVLRSRRDALMLRLGERLRLLSHPAEILREGLRLVAEELKPGRLGYGEIDESRDTITVLGTVGPLPEMSGHYSIDRAGTGFHDALRSGEVIRIDDTASEPRMEPTDLRARYQALGIGSALVVPVISGERYRAMLFAHEARPRHWSDGEEELLRAATYQLWREISRARAEAALRRSEERYRRMFEQANDLIIFAGLDQVITDVNPAAAAAIGLPREEVIGRSQSNFMSVAAFDQTKRMLQHKLEHGGTTQHVLEVISSSGRLLTWEVNSTLTLDDAGTPVGLHAIARDVTERQRAEERQRLLVNELNHRVKNTLALVQGLALQSFREGRDPAAARTAFQQRLAALAAAHDLLTRESWEGATLTELAQGAVGHLSGSEQRVGTEGPPVTLGPKPAVSLVMALHELATNAAKYGALSVPEGRVSLRWEAEEGGPLRLEWRETGGPPVAAPDRRGFGLRMIERALAADLAGRVEVEFNPEGLVCRIDGSLGETAPAQGEKNGA